MKIGSYAMLVCEPRQVWKEAAVSSLQHVPWGYLIRANCIGNVCIGMSKLGMHNHLIKSLKAYKNVFFYWVKNIFTVYIMIYLEYLHLCLNIKYKLCIKFTSKQKLKVE